MSSIYLPYQKIPRWNIDRATVAYNCARMRLPVPVGLWIWGGGSQWPDLSGQQNHITNILGLVWSMGGLGSKSAGGASANVPSDLGLNNAAQGLTHFVLFDSVGLSASQSYISDGRSSTGTYFVIGANAGGTVSYGGLNTLVTRSDLYSGGSITITDKTGESKAYFNGKYMSGAAEKGPTIGANLKLLSRFTEVDRLVGFVGIYCLFPVVFTPSQVAILNANPYGMVESIRRSIWIVPVGPTTVAPTTAAPTTIAPTTLAPTTLAPTTAAPTTPTPPTTAAPTTSAPTTAAPTAAPTTVAPTSPPTTLAPTTVAPPTTLAPTTPTLTTLAPTTAPPETICIKELSSIITKELSLGSLITKEIRSNGYLC